MTINQIKKKSTSYQTIIGYKKKSWWRRYQSTGAV